MAKKQMKVYAFTIKPGRMGNLRSAQVAARSRKQARKLLKEHRDDLDLNDFKLTRVKLGKGTVLNGNMARLPLGEHSETPVIN